MLKGKQGRFRQNLLGKRVDYSGARLLSQAGTKNSSMRYSENDGSGVVQAVRNR